MPRDFLLNYLLLEYLHPIFSFLPFLASSFVDHVPASTVLAVLRRNGLNAAHEYLKRLVQSGADGPLLRELSIRFNGESRLRLLIDGIWFSQPYGGISRVWNQIFSAWRLPGLISSESPVAIIDRGSIFAATQSFDILPGCSVDPLAWNSFEDVAQENDRFVDTWHADVFCSSWITSTGVLGPSLPEVSLVHDCIPERLLAPGSCPLNLRRRWWSQAASCLAVSSDTADDLVNRFGCSPHRVAWTHPAPDPLFNETVHSFGSDKLWQRLKLLASINEPYVLLPSTSAIGSYKNPEVVGSALCHPSLNNVQLVLCGIGADTRSDDLICRFPSLRGRILAAGFTDPELAMVYHHALAVVIPSWIEGFGLPAVEVMASGGLPLVADSRGLREAASEAGLRFLPGSSSQLVDFLVMLLDPTSHEWLTAVLSERVKRRLSRLNSDLIGLSLLAQARLAASLS